MGVQVLNDFLKKKTETGMSRRGEVVNKINKREILEKENFQTKINRQKNLIQIVNLHQHHLDQALRINVSTLD